MKLFRYKTSWDCDGILADYNSFLFKKLNIDLTVDDCYTFKIHDILREQYGTYLVDEAIKIQSDVDFTLNQPVLPWAKECIEIARQFGETIVVTAPWDSLGWYDARIEWLKKHFDFQKDDVFVGKKKHRVQADLFVDDKPQNIIDWCEDSGRREGEQAILLDWPYNRDVKHLPKNAKRMTPDQLLTRLRSVAAAPDLYTSLGWDE